MVTGCIRKRLAMAGLFKQLAMVTGWGPSGTCRNITGGTHKWFAMMTGWCPQVVCQGNRLVSSKGLPLESRRGLPL
jgi:hypothetical protein